MLRERLRERLPDEVVTRRGVLPQFEIGPRIGGAKVLFQRSGIVMRSVTMLSAMISAWSTTSQVRALFLGSFALFMAITGVVLVVWMAFDYVVLLPSEQEFNQGQAHTEGRSPLRRDTQEILRILDEDRDHPDRLDRLEPDDDD